MTGTPGTRAARRKIDADCTDNLELEVTPQRPRPIDPVLEIKRIQPENTIAQSDEPVNAQSASVDRSRTKKIDAFLENVQRLQASESKAVTVQTKSKPVASYEHRFKAQQSIIVQQKAMLDEQKRVIEDLRLNRIRKEAKESLESALRVFHQTAVKSNKFKHVAKERNELCVLSNRAPKMLMKMEARALEREEKRLIVRERKQLLDEERRLQAELAVQLKQKEEKDERERRQLMLREQREAVRQMELAKQRERKRFNDLFKRAETHRRLKLKAEAFRRFRYVISRIRLQMDIARSFDETNCVGKHFAAWRSTAATIAGDKRQRADALYKRTLAQRYLNKWIQVHKISVQKTQVAADLYEVSLLTKAFSCWHRIVCDYHVRHQQHLERAQRHHRKYLLFQCFERWRTLPQIVQIERVRDERKQVWRLKVAEVLSDYNPQKNLD